VVHVRLVVCVGDKRDRLLDLSAWAASNGEKMRSRRGRANSPVSGQESHSGDGRSWRIVDNLEVD